MWSRNGGPLGPGLFSPPLILHEEIQISTTRLHWIGLVDYFRDLDETLALRVDKAIMERKMSLSNPLILAINARRFL